LNVVIYLKTIIICSKVYVYTGKTTNWFQLHSRQNQKQKKLFRLSSTPPSSGSPLPKTQKYSVLNSKWWRHQSPWQSLILPLLVHLRVSRIKLLWQS